MVPGGGKVIFWEQALFSLTLKFSSEEIFMLRNGKLIKISMLDVDIEQHRQFYEDILSSFQFSE